MKSVVMKFGGTSVQDADAFERLVSIVSAQTTSHPVVVVSAMAGFTNALLDAFRLAREGRLDDSRRVIETHLQRHTDVAALLTQRTGQARISNVLDQARTELWSILDSLHQDVSNHSASKDRTVAFGEDLSARLLTEVFLARDIQAVFVDARRLIITDSEFGRATPNFVETNSRMRAELNPLISAGLIPVVGGFISSTLDGETTTLGRGGSDYTAAIVGAPLDAAEIQIWTDVSGVLTADPRIVPEAKTIPRLSYSEAAELAYFGAKVLHPKTILPAIEKGIPVLICNSRQPDVTGTIVYSESESAERTVKAIAQKPNITILQVSSARMLGAYGFLKRIFEIFDKYKTVVDVVSTSEVSVSLTMEDVTHLGEIARELGEIGEVTIERDMAIVCVVGEGLRNTPGIAGEVFSSLGDINISLISQGASRINLTFVVRGGRMHDAVSRLHTAFFE